MTGFGAPAIDLHKACQAGDADALDRLRAHHPDSALPDFQPTLSTAQLAIARQHGFGPWPRLKHAVARCYDAIAKLLRQHGGALQRPA